MRARKATTRIILVLALIGFLVSNAFADEAWYTCTINRVGGYTRNDGAIRVQLTDTKGEFKKVYFKIPEGRLNQILAVLLTAASTGSTVYVNADKDAKTLKAVYYDVE